ncbi:MAG TPA: hypothetical protein HPQ04_03640 [Rhodospirillaceae bacterium]|nr:hypothetical protein [Rhodospirillaceae bacterium]
MTNAKIALSVVIAAGASVRLSCNICAHSTVLPAAPLARRHGDGFRLDQLEQLGLCNICGSREVNCRPEYPQAPGAGSFGKS